jgi:hypothetical protein
MIIERRGEVDKIKSAKWVLVYGRRKTGKSFLVENNLKYDDYFFVNRDRTIISKNENTVKSYDAFIEILRRDLEEEKTVVVDEFHRLGGSFLDFIHSMKKSGRLVLVTSTLFLAKNFFSSHSPLLGFFSEAQIPIISLKDCLNALKKFDLNKKEMLELALVLREPLAVQYFNEKQSSREMLVSIITGSLNTIPALVGEVFTEEDRSVSKVYEGVLSSIASGKGVSTEICNYLFSRKLIPKNDPSLIQQYLENLVKIGILRKIWFYNKNKFFYTIESPLVRFYYYANERYSVSERKAGKEEVKRIVDDLMPRIVEDNVRERVSEKYGLTETVYQTEQEIDGCLLKFKKPYILLEVKWGVISQQDVNRIEKKLAGVKAKRKILFVRDKSNLSSSTLEIIDVSDL